MFITENHKELMRRALENGRNFFGTDENCNDALLFDEIVAGGLATKQDAPAWSGYDLSYQLTDDGKFIVNRIGN